MINQQLNKRRLSLYKLVPILYFLAIIFTALPAHALSTSTKAIGINQSYTITYSGNSYTYLQEKKNNGSWRSVVRSTKSKSFKQRTPGTYRYRTYRTNCGGSWHGSKRRQDGCTRYSAPISVRVYAGAAPALDSIDKQERYKFETRIGDINNDGRKDIYVRRLSGHADNGVISQAILAQNSNYTFRTFNANANQLAKAKRWSKVYIETALGDFNLDGYVDVFLKGVNKKIYAAKDNIVFSQGAPFHSQAKAVKNIDANFKKTFSSVANWIVDEDYFKDNMITRYQWVVYPVYAWNPRTDRWELFWMTGRKKTRVYNPNVITQDAVKMKNELFDIFKKGVDKSPYESINKLANFLSDSLGVEVSIGSKSRECKDAGFVKSLVVVANPVTLQVCRVAFGKILQTIARVTTIGESLEDKGEMIFRVFGGQATMEGRSWTPVNPIGHPDYRNKAGLPKTNACTNLVMGIVRQSKRNHYMIREALKVTGPGNYYQEGGLEEYYFHMRPLKSLGIIEYGRVVPMTPPC